MFQTILEDIDKVFAMRPVFVFGYSQLMRGISCASPLPRSLTVHMSQLSCTHAHRYRSKKRVPTHYTLLHGGAMSIDLW